MKAEYKDLYKKRNQDTGLVSTVFRYLLSGKQEDLERYRAILEEDGIPVHTDESTGKLLYFDTVFHGKICQVSITETNRIIVPNDQMDFLQSQLRLVTDPVVKQEMAKKIAEYQVNKITGGGISEPAAPAAPVAEETASPSDATLDD